MAEAMETAEFFNDDEGDDDDDDEDDQHELDLDDMDEVSESAVQGSTTNLSFLEIRHPKQLQKYEISCLVEPCPLMISSSMIPHSLWLITLTDVRSLWFRSDHVVYSKL